MLKNIFILASDFINSFLGINLLMEIIFSHKFQVVFCRHLLHYYYIIITVYKTGANFLK